MTTAPHPDLLDRLAVAAESPLFDGEVFPTVDFVNKELVALALGEYAIKTRYFDAAWNEVDHAGAPGRYGAWVEIHFASGVSCLRQVTLFKTTGPYHPVLAAWEFVATLPAVLGISPDVVAQESWNVNQLLNRMTGSGLSAVLAATLQAIETDPAQWRGFNYWYIEECWWTTLRQKLNRSPAYRYLTNLPAEYDSAQERRWPLLLFLHGTYECGDDLELLRTQGPQGFITRGHELPFIVVSPQCPKGCSWNPRKLLHLIEEIERAHRVDSSRIYVTGLSMGGFSTFDLAACYPEKIAAIAALSAGENPEIAARMQRVPAWIFHGAEDRIVSARQSIAIAEQLKQRGAEVRLTVLPGVGHEGWEKIYAKPELYEWFLQHSLEVTP